ncbi:hypothetical protein [Phenylobacterium sp.]|uniref:hypothetical protein n=1 Tax=Phenylobacterium sp. TaxID=1871053 RepID=UPI0025EF004C|nr:hypothetical protein [Phenylobacterium sp.]MBX3485002.1 hypothetical protein [Phenylobacterium sp.]MCW5759802.1 hypothetical protein [Phenylobacterium sp.]
MAKEPSRPNGHDPRVTDLKAYRKEKEKAARKPPPKPTMRRPSESFLGSNPRAALILVAAIVILALLYLGPRFL